MSVIRVKLVTSSLFGSRNYFKGEDKFSRNFKEKEIYAELLSGNKIFKQW